MFNGIIQGKGIIVESISHNNTFNIKTNLNLEDCIVGSSICCDGICLTIIEINYTDNYYIFLVNVSEETNIKSITKYWKNNTKINLEKSLKFNQEISGHLIYGHVDYTSELHKVDKLDNSWNMYFSYPSNDNKKFIVKKGSICINGISLTISELFEENFSVSIIPHTYNQTNISLLEIKDKVNVEFDMIARYVFNK
tara:strand:- start:434 stop:1021 length:588 start_codon:yes stop_codon:yes gene_type:complete